MPKVSDEHKEKVRDTIIKAAIKNFSKNGLSNTKMDDISNTANVSKGTLYLYFPSKEDLFLSILKENQRILIDTRTGLFTNHKNLESDLGKFFDLMVGGSKDTERIWIEGIAESNHNPRLKTIVNSQRKEIEVLVTEFLRQMKKEVGLFKKESDLATLANGMIGLFNGLTVKRLSGDDYISSRNAWIKTMMAIFLGS
ncbi:TetR family transcriptional regulator [Nitrosarchaeum sp.]|nr:TetR family transcriptional regulator [Nitrosarchaeum sp.]